MGVCLCAWGKQPALGCILAGDPALWDRDSASLWRGERSAPHSHRGWGAAADLSGTIENTSCKGLDLSGKTLPSFCLDLTCAAPIPALYGQSSPKHSPQLSMLLCSSRSSADPFHEQKSWWDFYPA